jgi:hypothetical protein
MEVLKIYFSNSNYFIWIPRAPNYLLNFFWNFWDSSRYIYHGLKDLSGFFYINFKLENMFWNMNFFSFHLKLDLIHFWSNSLQDHRTMMLSSATAAISSSIAF